MKTLLLSPHLDDAVLSAGAFLANQPGCVVATVFAGLPGGQLGATPYDAKTGFKTSREAMQARRLEDRDALALLRAEPVYLDYLDHQYGRTYTVEQMASAIVSVAEGYDLVLGPLGLVHPDHELLGDALVSAANRITADVYLWEDLPNRVLHPDEAYRRLSRPMLPATFKAPGGAGTLADKVRSLLCYRSQLGTGDLDFNVLLVPERFWRLEKTA